MITVMSYLEKLSNLQLLKEEFHSQAAYYSDEDWKYLFYQTIDEVRAALLHEPLLDLLCWNLGTKESLAELEKVRKIYQEAFLLLIADAAISPMEYLRPAIRPTALLLQPFDQEKCRDVLGELIESYCSRFEKAEEEDVFLVETREGRWRVPLSQISFVEAREKKIYICTRSDSYGFYETIDHMMELLPSQFVRCHRSFIVNMEKVRKLHLQEGLVELVTGETVPVSRSYRKEVRGRYYGDA